MVALSPDGKQLAYVATPSGIYLRPMMSSLEATMLPGTDAFKGVREPVFAPDGSSIAFFAVADQTIKTITAV